MKLHNFINSIAIGIVALICLMNSMNIKSIFNVVEKQNNVIERIVNNIDLIIEVTKG